MSYLPLRLSFYYICVFAIIGIVLPFWPVWLASVGLSETEIGIIAAVPILAKMVFSPIFANFADKIGHRKKLLNVLIGLALFFFTLYFFANSFAAFIVISILYGICWAPVMSFGDSIVLLSIRDRNIQYGKLRLWGSLSFIAMSFGLGLLMEQTGENIIIWAMLICIILAFVSSLTLPDIRFQPSGLQGKPVFSLLKITNFKLFLLSVALIHGSHALYYGFATIHWRSLGYSDYAIGLLWAWSVIVEVLFFLFSARIGKYFGAVSFLMMAAGACLVRWTIMIYDPNIYVLFMIQSLHGLTFGAMHTGAMKYINERVSLDLSTSAQSLYGASAFGLGTGITMLSTGYLYNHMNSMGYLVMTLMAVCGIFITLLLRHRTRKGHATLRLQESSLN